MNRTRIRTQLANRSAVVAAGVAGFLVGAGGFVAAQIDDAPTTELATEPASEASAAGPSTTTSDTMLDRTAAGFDDPAPTVIDLTVPTVTVDDHDSTSSVPTVTIDDHSDHDDDSSSSSVPTVTIDDHRDDDSTSSVPTATIDDHRDDDSSSSSSVPTVTIDDHDDDSSSSVPTVTIDDHDDDSSSSVPASLPAPFSRSYQSAGGSIDVTWTGTAFVLSSISPAPGFTAEIEDQSWDRIRVDFEGDGEARIEVRLDDGQLRVRID